MRNTVAKPTFIILAFNVALGRKIISMKTLYERGTHTVAKLTFIILAYNVTFINKSYGDTKRRRVI